VYVRSFREGILNPAPELATVREAGATRVVDADNGLGVVVGQLAMDQAVELAAAHGVGVVAVRNSGHAGMLAIHVLRAAARGMIGFFTSNTPAIMPPWGGLEPRLGNGPIAYAIPADGDPVVLDMACSAVARGKIRLYADRGEPLPDGWALDRDGRATRDPHAALEGVVLPMATYKGYALAFVNEVLAAALSGAALAADMPRDFLREGSTVLDRWCCGHLAIAFDVASFAEPAAFRATVGRLRELMRTTPPAPDGARVLVPGEPEAACRAERIRDGVPLDPATLERLRAFAAEAGLAPLRSTVAG
jgi:LDH2 family malate/lactate/ureidoglycolate dehydrogenase